MDKAQIRARMRSLLAEISPDERHTRSLAVCRKLAETREFRNAQLIMLFLSMENEVETSTLAIQAWKDGKSIAVPRIRWRERQIEPVEIKSLDTTSGQGGASLREPVQGTVVSLGLIDLVAVPGMAFDRSGYRVGRGKGFYDRFLSQGDFQGLRIALCFHEQLIDETIPFEAHDIPMQMIVTDRQIVRCGR